MQQGVSLEQQQKLFLTTEMMQGISMVAMSAKELVEYVHDQMYENPFLEEAERPIRKHPCEEKRFDHRPSADELVGKTQRCNRLYGDGSQSKQKQTYAFEDYLVQQPTLDELLLAQLDVELSSEQDIKIAQYLVGSLDSKGFLRISTYEVAMALSVAPGAVERVLGVLQQCDPVGVGARNIKEFLLLQLDARHDATPLARQIVNDYLGELANGRLGKIAKALGVPIASVQQVYNLIRTLRSHNDLQTGENHDASVWPEIVVVKEGDGYILTMQDLQLPELTLNQEYIELAAKPHLEKETFRYLHREQKAAQGLIEGISRRRDTLFKVACCIVEAQSEFLDKGIELLRPLTMKQIAHAANLSESTVSRVVNNNFIQTPHGTFELRDFFSSGIAGANGLDVAAKSIERLIQELIAAEDSRHPLSDDDIKDALANRGVVISRRTVNKYRTKLGIPANSKRKQYS